MPPRDDPDPDYPTWADEIDQLLEELTARTGYAYILAEFRPDPRHPGEWIGRTSMIGPEQKLPRMIITTAEQLAKIEAGEVPTVVDRMLHKPRKH